MSSSCYDVLLRHFICVHEIQTDYTVVGMLQNLSHKYYSQYSITKFVRFESIWYQYLFPSIYILLVLINKIIFFSKKNNNLKFFFLN